MFEVYDVNFDETIERVKTMRKAQEICRDLNEGKLEPMYAVKDSRPRDYKGRVIPSKILRQRTD